MTTTCLWCEAMLTRNARLIVRLRRFAAAIHRLEQHPGLDWITCEAASCVAARVTIEQPQAGHWDHLSRTPDGSRYVTLFQDGPVT